MHMANIQELFPKLLSSRTSHQPVPSVLFLPDLLHVRPLSHHYRGLVHRPLRKGELPVPRHLAVDKVVGDRGSRPVRLVLLGRVGSVTVEEDDTSGRDLEPAHLLKT